MLSTKSMKASVPMTLTFSCTGSPRNMRRRPRPSVCSGRMRALLVVRPQPDDRHDVLHVPAFAQHHHRDDRLVADWPDRRSSRASFAELVQLFLALAGGRLGNLAVVFRVDHQHRVLQLGVSGSQDIPPPRRSCACRRSSRTGSTSFRSAEARHRPSSIRDSRGADNLHIAR